MEVGREGERDETLEREEEEGGGGEDGREIGVY